MPARNRETRPYTAPQARTVGLRFPNWTRFKGQALFTNKSRGAEFVMSYVQSFDTTPAAERWPLVRNWIFHEPLPFLAELRQSRPILAMPEVTLAVRFDDCMEVLRRHDIFSVALYRPKQGDYWMAQDDTAVHWREKSIMQAVLDREDIPKIRTYVADKAAALIAAAQGEMDIVAGLTRAVPLALVQDWFGFADSDPAELKRWSYWNQMDAFWNQPFDAIAVRDPHKIRRGAGGRQRSHARLSDRPDSAPGRRASGRTRRSRSGVASIDIVIVEGAEI